MWFQEESKRQMKTKQKRSKKKEKSILIFELYVQRKADGTLDASKVLGRTCFEHWLNTRGSKPKNPPEAFRKALTSHCAGVDGRKPFEPELERALLNELRQKKVWPCFIGTKSKVGLRGFQVKGYWERRKYSVPQETVDDQNADDFNRKRKPEFSDKSDIESLTKKSFCEERSQEENDEWILMEPLFSENHFKEEGGSLLDLPFTGSFITETEVDPLSAFMKGFP